MPEQDIPIEAGARGKLRYDKKRRTIVGDGVSREEFLTQRLAERGEELEQAKSERDLLQAALECYSEEQARLRSASGAWEIVLKWLDDYTEEEATFSRYRDDVILDGIMTAAQRRALAVLFPKSERMKPATERCPNCGNDLPLMFPCYHEECPIPGSY